MLRVLAKSSRKDFDALALPSVRGSDSARRPARARATPAISHSARAEADQLQQQAADEKANALHRVLRAGEPRDPAEQLTGAACRRRLDRGLRGRLGQVLGDAGDALRGHDPGYGSAALHSGWSADSISSPAICSVSPIVSMRGMPKRAASHPPPRLAKMPAASYSRNRNASMNGV